MLDSLIDKLIAKLEPVLEKLIKDAVNEAITDVAVQLTKSINGIDLDVEQQISKVVQQILDGVGQLIPKFKLPF